MTSSRWLLLVGLWMCSTLVACAGDALSPEPGPEGTSVAITEWHGVATSARVADVVYVDATDDYVVAGQSQHGVPLLEGPLDALVAIDAFAAAGNILSARVWTDGDNVFASTQFGPYIPALAERRNGEWTQHWDGIGYLIYPIAATTRDDVYAGAPERMLHFDGDAVEVTDVPMIDNVSVVPAWNGGEHGLWGIGRGFNDTPAGIYQWRSDHWALDSTFGVGEMLHALWGDESGLRFAISDQGLYTREGDTWTNAYPGLELFDIAGAAANDVYAVGEQGALLHFDGTEWSLIPGQTYADLTRISIATREILIVTEDGDVLRGLR